MTDAVPERFFHPRPRGSSFLPQCYTQLTLVILSYDHHGACTMSAAVEAPLAVASGAGADEREVRRELEEMEKTVRALQGLKRHMETDTCSQIMVEIMTSIVDELSFDVCADVHRAHRMDLLPLDDAPGQPSNRVVDSPGYDIHGLIPEKVPKNEFFLCDFCHTRVGAQRYTDHLSKCMLNRGRTGRAVRGTTAATDTNSAWPQSTSPANPGKGGPSPTMMTSPTGHGAASPVQHTKQASAASPVQHAKQAGQPCSSPAVETTNRSVQEMNGRTEVEALGKRQRDVEIDLT